MSLNKTIIYITNNVLDKDIAEVCQKYLIIAAKNNPIISVSQKPMNLGFNINVGDIGSSWLNIYKQQLIGLKEARTEFVAIAEHDVLYTEDHFNWIPPTNDTFYYNSNCCLVEWNGNHPELNGMYSRWTKSRKALSQLICDRKLLIHSIEERMVLFEGGIRVLRKLGEPGAFPPEIVKAARLATSGSSCHLSRLLEKHLSTFKSDMFTTKKSNLDIRHSNNFTGPRRGNSRTFELPYWGEFKHIMRGM
jgi:hypothetical protein